MTDPLIKLRELAAYCRVRIGTDLADAPDEGGSGVWIAPGMALTCAHVLPGGLHSKVQVGWRDHVVTGTVTDLVPDTPAGGLWPYPDLAIISVENPPQHPCAWLSETAPAGSLAAFGHSAALGEGLQQIETIGTLGGSHAFGGGRFWQFKGNELVSGMSGGPVLDLASGSICGLVSATIGEGADRGGYIIPIEGLRHLGAQRRRELLNGHDQFHGRDRLWSTLRTQLPRPPGFSRYLITPAEEVELLELLAQFPVTDSEQLLALVARNLSDGRAPTPPGALRDVVYALLDSGGLDSALVMSVLRMIHHLVGANPKHADLDLYNWATAFAARHQMTSELRGLRHAPATAVEPSGVISVEIVPGAASVDLFRLTVSVERQRLGRRPIYQDQDPVHTLDEIKQIACHQLRIALGWLAGSAYIEFIVPIELFDEPFDELVPTRPYTNLGRKYCVVLRDYDRQSNPLAQHDWRRRWEQIQNPSPGGRWITCTEDLSPDEFSAELEQHPETAVVALTRSPSSNEQISEMLQVALESGVPVAIWRRGTCAEHDASAVDTSCSGRRFQTAFSQLLSIPAIGNLPETVRQLRNRAAMKSAAPADNDCRGTVLLWDDPARMAQLAAAVREPPYHLLENAQ
jgi:vWA-MoxR associated protein C-terminal domain/Trypsin-like peptidase domain